MDTLDSTNKNLSENLNLSEDLSDSLNEKFSHIEPPTAEIQSKSNLTNDNLKTIGEYARVLRAQLPAKYFEPRWQRLLWILGYGGTAAICVYAIVFLELGWPFKVMAALILGNCYGAFGFIAHELLHGSVIKNQKVAEFISFPLLIPMFISPTYWKFWHNRLHHGKTQQLITDPDAYPTTRVFKHSKFMQFMYPFTPGSGHLRSYLYFFIWFSTHSFVSQLYMRYRNNLYDQANHRRISVEFYLQLAIWAAFLTWVSFWAGPSQILYVWIIPFFAQNYYVMSYIATNHNLNPLTKVNDPLANSLTVTNHPVLEALHFNFGYHVEHHIFPTMSSAYTKHVHRILKKDFAGTYLQMTKWEAIRRLYATARIYKNSSTLINPETGKTYPTL